MTGQVDLEKLRGLAEDLRKLVELSNPGPDAAFQLNWNLKVAQWRGESLAALEEISKVLARHSDAMESIPRDALELERRFDDKLLVVERRLGDRITTVQIKAAGVSAGVTLLVTVVLQILLPYFIK